MRWWMLCFAMMAGPALWGRSAGIFDRVSGAPGDGTCQRCHGSTVGPGNVRIELNSPTYTPGVPQRIRVVITDPDQRRFGFQLAVRPANADATGGPAGQFRPIDDRTQAFCMGNSVPQAAPPCGGNNPLAYIMHNATGSRLNETPPGSATFEVEWTPPDPAIGDVRFFVAGNAANGNANTQGDRIYLANATLSAVGVARPSVSQTGVVNGATLRAEQGITTGGFLSIFGTNLAGSTQDWGTSFRNGLAPALLGNVRVLVNDREAFVAYVSPTQINAVAPADPANGPVSIVVERAGVRSDPVSATKRAAAPAFFPFEPQSRRYVAAHTATGTFAYIAPANLFGGPLGGQPVRPARPGEVIVVYGSGFGATNPPLEIGRLPTTPAPLAVMPALRLGNTPVTAQFAGIASLVGVHQFNLVVPSVAAGEYELIATVDGVSSPSGLFLAVQP